MPTTSFYIHPTTGRPIGWAPGTTIRYYVDPGGLGRLTNEQARTLLAEAMKIWENASPYANVPKFEFAGLLPEDVNKDNYARYVSGGACFTDSLSSCPSDAQKNLQTVIIFDDDSTSDSILNKELCRIGGCGASAGARVFSGSQSNPGNIVQGIAVFGNDLSASSASLNVGSFVHELGHMLGLAHTYVNQQLFLTSGPTEENAAFLPAMEIVGGILKAAATLNPDDIAGITALYPSSTASANTGTIKGQILKSDGTPMESVNVIARNNDDPLCEAYSFLAGRICVREGLHVLNGLTQGGCVDTDSHHVPISDFTLTLPPGTYTLEVEEVADKNLAFTLAPGLVDPFIQGDAEFWNVSDSASESNTDKSFISLAAGEIKENINIVLNRSSVTSDRVKYIPLSAFTPGPGTRCPKEPPVDYDALIGVSNNNNNGSNTAGRTNTLDPGAGCSLIPF